jgi:hypothetical protein
VADDELVKMKEDYPYASVFSYVYTQKLKQQNNFLFNKEVSYTKLFFNNHRWLHFLLCGEGELEVIKGIPTENVYNDDKLSIEEEIIEHKNEIKAPETTTEGENSVKTEEVISTKGNPVEMAFEPYHTVDYFASQGIKLGQIDSTDKLGQKVKSFTDWLKTMKRMQAEEDKNTSMNQEATLQNIDNQQVESIVITEAMAEIYQKQGLNDKAIEVYTKLSLQNPNNSHIFANRIKALKENRP